ncbi:peptidase M66 [Solimonas sp. K1W22B-7]|uniref:M66 family metalloprotease n=1 Tax=Solimonas sp. K1W22B-7 TaxID=2303331 RepID=UPI000E32F110|nr:M66 family metalloprotease [Solimonas sp. K1W22B-7]AXQ30209.1 peptidase M66 [Solimonas sp. K1W22B-7]
MVQGLRVLVLGGLGFLLAACGGGGDDGGTPAPANQAPAAAAGSDQAVAEGATVTLSGGSSSDSDGSIVAYAWQQVSGPAVVLDSPTAVSTRFVAPDVATAQTVVLRLTVTDNEGATDTDMVSVTVNVAVAPPANNPPVAAAGADQVVNEGATVTLSGSGSSDGDGSIAGYAWAQVSGPTVSLANAATVSASFVAPDVSSAQVLVLRLTVTDDDGATASDTVSVTVNAVAAPATITVSGMKLAQTHVLPAAGKQWTLGSNTSELHMVGGRAALALVDLSPSGLAGLKLQGEVGGVSQGTVTLDVNSALPANEDSSLRYSGSAYVATLPQSWLKPGLRLRVTATGATASAWTNVVVGSDSDFTVRILPFYLFGATEADVSLATAGAPSADAIDDMFAVWPVATVEVGNHPAAKVSWPSLVVPPRGDSAGVRQPAYVASNTDGYKDGFAGLSTLHGIVSSLRGANGEANLAVQYYAPLLARNASGRFQSAGGGIGGGSVGTGDTAYAGIFIHEQGHAFGLPHAGDSYDSGNYPYEWGSLKGSEWGFDAVRRLFRAILIPASSSNYAGCRSHTFGGHARAVDGLNRCIKQDPMQSGAGDQASGQRFTIFSDFSTAVMQRYFEGITTLNSDSSHKYSGGKWARDASFPSGYKRWDSIDRRWVNAADAVATADGGLWGFEDDAPLQRNVPVYAIVVTMSYAGTAGATQIYPPLRFSGNLLRTIDPTVQAQRESIVPNTSTYYWYCKAYGCDYTLRVRYANGTVRNVALQSGFRGWFAESGPVLAAASDPLDGASFRRWAVNVPDDGNIASIQLLETPQVWNGLPASPRVLASR